MPLDACEEASCRICLESDKIANLCQPCACRGTQAWVHPGCLKKWQQTRDTDTRKNLCPVCRHVYTAEFIEPASPSRASPIEELTPNRLGLSTWSWALLTGAALGLFALLPLAFASAALAALSVAVLGLQRIVEALLRLVGVRLAFVVDEDGSPLLRVLRVGSEIRGLTAGALLVSTDHIGGGIFERSVIVLTEHNAHGTKGYILNVPYERIRHLGHGRFGAADDGAPLRHALAAPTAPDGTVQHGLGGPVELGGWAAVLHTYPGIPGATPLLVRAAHGATAHGTAQGAAALNDAEAQAEAAPPLQYPGAPPAPRDTPPVYIGGDTAALRAAVERDATVGGATGWRGACRLKVLYGHAAWAPGQLEGEIRAHGARLAHAHSLGSPVASRRTDSLCVHDDGGSVEVGG